MSLAPFVAPGRDDGFAFGRLKESGTTYYSLPGVVVTLLGQTTAPTLGYDYYSPLYLASPVVVDQMAMQVTTLQAASNVRFGLYRADTSFQPIGGPLVDSGDISTAASGVKTYTPGTPVYLQRGRYVTVFNVDTASLAFSMVRGYCVAGTALGTSNLAQAPQVLRVARAHAAFPTPGTAWAVSSVGAGGGVEYAVFLRASGV